VVRLVSQKQRRPAGKIKHEIEEMTQRTAAQLVREAAVATVIPNLVWSFLSWRFRLAVGAIYVWPWAFVTTLWYVYRAYKLDLDPRLGDLTYYVRSIRVASLPFLAALLLPWLNIAFDRHAPDKSPPIALLASIFSWSLSDLFRMLARWRREASF
jgi:cellulose synthase/poly-beta-1,6-N-acetylglucosamine synthase-like glycosyltransferase